MSRLNVIINKDKLQQAPSYLLILLLFYTSIAPGTSSEGAAPVEGTDGGALPVCM